MNKDTLTWKLHREYAGQLVDAGLYTEPVPRGGVSILRALGDLDYKRSVLTPAHWVARVVYDYQDRLHQLWMECGKPEWDLEDVVVGEWSDVDENGWVRLNINDYLYEWVREEFLQADLLVELINEILEERKEK